MSPANPENYQEPRTSTSGDLFTKNTTDDGDSEEGVKPRICTKSLYSEAINSEASRVPSNSIKKGILKPDSTVHAGDSDTETYSLPSLLTQDDAIIMSDDSDSEAKMLSFNTEDKQ